MRKCINLILILLTICNVAFAPAEKVLYMEKEKPIFYYTPTKVEIQFKLFTEHLGFKESSNRWKIINSLGCMGKWQFSSNTLYHLGYDYITPQSFKENPDIFSEALQYKILCAYFKYNEKTLKDYMHFVGQTVNNVKITKSGLLAAAHLAGSESVKLFLDSKGQTNKKDINEMSVRNYLIEFAGYKI